MECENCKGTGESPADKSKPCFLCDGGGEMCDVCGEATGEPGQNVCDECQEEGGDQ